MKKSIFNRIFIVYIFLLIVLVVVKFDFHKGYLQRIEQIKIDREAGFWNINLYPFKTITGYINGYEDNCDFYSIFYNIIGNIAAYVPFGCLLPLIHERYSGIVSCFKFGITFIVVMEMCQFITMLGYFDIDDIILNTLGILLGYIIYIIAGKLKILNLLKEK